MSGWLQNRFLRVCHNSIIVCACEGTWSVGYFGTILSQLPSETICAIKSFIPSTVLSWQPHTSAHPEEKIYIKSLSGSSPAQDARVLSAAKTSVQYSTTIFGFIKPQGRLVISISPLNTQTYFPLKTLIFASLSTPSYTAVSIIITLYKRPRTGSGYLSMFVCPHFLPGEHQNNLTGPHLAHVGWHTLVSSGARCHPKGNDAGDREKGFMLKVSHRILALELFFEILNSTRVLHSRWWGTQLCQCPGFAQREACRKAGGSMHSPRAAAAHTNLHPPRESGFWLGPCVAFIGALFIFRWSCCSIATQLVSNWPGRFLLPSCPVCWQNNKVWRIYVPRHPRRSCERSLLLRRGSFCWQMPLFEVSVCI